MFYDESINTKLSNYPFSLVQCRHLHHKMYMESFRIIQMEACVSTGLKPSRQCSCRLTHRILHCMPGSELVQFLFIFTFIFK